MQFLPLPVQVRLEHLNLILELLDLLRLSERSQQRLCLHIFLFIHYLRLCLFDLLLFMHGLLNEILLLLDFLLLFLNLLLEFIVLGQAPSQIKDNGFEGLDLALLDVYFGFGLLQEPLQFRNGVLAIHFRLILDVSSSLPETESRQSLQFVVRMWAAGDDQGST